MYIGSPGTAIVNEPLSGTVSCKNGKLKSDRKVSPRTWRAGDRVSLVQEVRYVKEHDATIRRRRMQRSAAACVPLRWARRSEV